jgi:MoaD family protein
LRIVFKSFGQLRRVLGGQSIDIDVPDKSTIRDVIDRVIAIGGPSVKRQVMEGDRISGSLIVLLNKRDIDTLQGANTVLSEGDEVAILPHVQGGTCICSRVGQSCTHQLLA